MILTLAVLIVLAFVVGTNNPHARWFPLYIVLPFLLLFVASWVWFILVPRVSLKIAGGDRQRQRRLLQCVVNTPFVEGTKGYARFLLGVNDQVAKRYAEAEVQFRALLAECERGVSPGLKSVIQQHFADTLEALGRRHEAESVRQQAGESLSDGKETVLSLQAQGNLLSREHRYAEAYDTFERALSLVPGKNRQGRTELMMHLVLSSFNAGRPADTLLWAEKLIAEDPSSPRTDAARRMAAIACNNMGRLHDAERYARLAAEMAPTPEKRAESLALLGDYVMRRGDLIEAERLAHQAEALNPGKKRVPWALLASIKKEQGLYREAIAASEHGNNIPGGHIPALNRRATAVVNKALALLYAEVGELEKASSLMHSSEAELSEDPKLGVTLDAAAAILHGLRHEPEESRRRISSCEQGLKSLPEDRGTQRAALYWLGRAALLIDEPKRAEAFLRAYLDLNPDPLYRPYAYYHLAECRRRLGDSLGGLNFDRKAAATRMGSVYEQLARERLEAEGVPVAISLSSDP
jgi:tetratricopeptide (TPR) repeat protein